MAPRFQFGLRQLFIATLWFATSATVARTAVSKAIVEWIGNLDKPARNGLLLLAVLAVMANLGAGVGSLFGRTLHGARLGAGIVFAILILALMVG